MLPPSVRQRRPREVMENQPGCRTISVADARKRLAAEDAVFIDIRDLESYEQGHVPGAIHLDDGNVTDFMATSDRNVTHIIYCYHGITSRSGAAYFEQNGFADVFSMDGGYCAW